MATKTYISRNTIPHFSVGDRRVAFHPSSMGNSFFTTDDPVDGTNKPDKPNKELKEMHFDTLADAKNYLATEFGAVRSNIRTTENAINIGKANGVKVVFDK